MVSWNLKSWLVSIAISRYVHRKSIILTILVFVVLIRMFVLESEQKRLYYILVYDFHCAIGLFYLNRLGLSCSVFAKSNILQTIIRIVISHETYIYMNIHATLVKMPVLSPQ